MSRLKITGFVMGGIAVLLLLLVLAGVIVMQTGWFREIARDRVERALEDATRGKVEIGEFQFDWRRLRIEIRNLVIRGLEKPPEPPLFRARLVRIDLRMFTALKRPVDLAAVLIDEPQANIVVYENGSTNIPPRAVKEPVPERTALEAVVDLAIGEFALRNGSLRFGERRVPLHASGRNLRAQLVYDRLMPGYKGELAIGPVDVSSGARRPVAVSLAVPLVLERDRIRFEKAVVSTPESRLTITGAVTNLRNAEIDAHVRGYVSLAEAQRAAGLNVNTTGNVPRVLQADVNLHVEDERISLSDSHLRLGQSTLHAAGVLRDAQQPAGLDFSGTAHLGEIGRLLRLPLDPAGVADVSGNATLRNGEYLVRADVDARRLAFTIGPERFTNVALVSAVRLDPRRLELTGMHARILGGAFTGRATIEEWDRFEAAGRIDGFDVELLTTTFANLEVPWGGALSGPVEVRGDFDAPADLVARGSLAVSPAPQRGIPMTGRINVSYDGRTDTIQLAQSWVALPRSRVDFTGTLGQRLDVRLSSRDLREVAVGFTPPVELDGGAAFFDGVVLGRLTAPQVSGRVRLTGFRVQDRRFNQLIADVDLSESRVVLRDGTLQRGALDARFNAVLGLQRYRASQRSPVTLNATIRNAGVEDALAVAGQPGIPATGTLNAAAQITGTIGDPRGEVALDVLNGAAWQQPFDRLAVRALLQQGLIRVPTLWIGAGPARVSGELAYNYTPGELRRGVLTGQVASTNVELAQVRAVAERRPSLAGIVSFDAAFAVNVRPAAGATEFEVARLNANLAARGLQMQGRPLGGLTAAVRTANNVVSYNFNSDFANSTLQVAGRTTLAPGYPTEANARIVNLPLEPALAVAGRPDIALTGNLDATARVTGPLTAPRAGATFTLTDTAYEGHSFDRVQAAVNVTERLIEVPSLIASSGDARLTGAARLAHPGDYRTGDLRFQFQTNRFEIAKVPAIRSLRPGLTGSVEARAEGAATLRPAGDPLLDRVNALVTASGIQVNGARVGDLHAVAETRGGDLHFDVKSDFAGADIHAAGTVRLAGDYPLAADLTFANLTYAGIEPLVALERRRGFDAVAQGRASISGPAARPEDLSGKFEITRLEMYSVVSLPGQPVRRAVQVRNAEPVVFALERGLIRIGAARFFGPFANFEVTGSASVRAPYPLNLRATGEARLELAEAFVEDVFASGNVFLNAVVQGTARDPQIAGRIDLRNADFSRIDWPAGISEAQGSILFSGQSAVVQNVTGLVGGGKVTVSGAVAYGGPEWTFRLQAVAREIRVQYPQNVSTAMNAEMSLTGARSRSLLSGEVTILDVAFYTHTDIGSIFASAARPTPVPPAQVGLLGNMRLDIRVETAPDIQFRTTLAENIEADAQLQVRGTAARPGALGRLEVTTGEIEFFGTRYKIDQGSVAFYNPSRLEPIVNIDLTTRARGIDVTLTVSGPMDRLQLTYRSDPPLQFGELVALLATGAVPTTDPVLVANEPTQPHQTFQQMGASTLLGQAVATPVAGRLQRLFGVTSLRIDPQIVGTENVPQARFTLEQQVTPDLLFTYIQDVTESNPQVIRVEWAFNPTWSVVAQRQENGVAAVDLFWRRRFR